MFKVGNDPFRQFGIGRHLEFGIGMSDRLEQPTLVRFARHDRRPAVATVAKGLAGVDA